MQPARYQALTEQNPDGILLTSRTGHISFANPAARILFGQGDGELAGYLALDHVHPKNRQALRRGMVQIMRQPDLVYRARIQVRSSHHGWQWLEVSAKNLLDDPELQSILWTCRSAAGESTQAEDLGRSGGEYSTGPSAGDLIRNQLRRMLGFAANDGSLVAVVKVRFNDLTLIEDDLGTETGKRIVTWTPGRLKKGLRNTDVWSRTAHDEYTIIYPNLAHSGAAASAVDRTLVELRRPIPLGGRDIQIRATAGVALFPQDGGTPDVLLRRATLALQEAGTNEEGFRFFDATLTDQARHRLDLETAMRNAVEWQQFYLEYQPQFDLERRTQVGQEALIRWKHPTKGTISPLQFIPLAEETGLIVPIGRWVLHAACQQAKSWEFSGHPPIRIAVNVSAVQFGAEGFVDTVLGTLQKTGLKPSQLNLEITETALMGDVKQAAKHLHRLRELGISVAIDDFGTGYSSLGQLRQLAIDIIKIDRAMLSGAEFDSTTRPMLEAVIALGHTLGMTVIGEGIETEQQLEILRLAGCDQGQGYLFGRPVPAEKVLHADECQATAKTVLLVEDEELVLGLARTILRREGYDVLEARNGRDALRLCGSHRGPIDLILTDMLLPGLAGQEFIRQAVVIRPNVRVILMSGYNVKPTLDIPASVHWCFLRKPFDSSMLAKTVNEAMSDVQALGASGSGDGGADQLHH